MSQGPRSPERTRLRLGLAGWLLLSIFLLASLDSVQADWDLARILGIAEQRYGNLGPGRERIEAWHRLLLAEARQPEHEQLNAINHFFNQQLSFQDDQRIWHQGDYWATPIEALIKGSGDCEDYALAKYFSLRDLGVASEKLRIAYIKGRTGRHPHMVLTYYASPRADPLVLDNLVDDIRPASLRRDLKPVYAFNAQALYLPGTADRHGVDSMQLSRWQDVLKKIRAEGFIVGDG